MISYSATFQMRFIHKTYWEYDAKKKAAVERRFIMKWIKDAGKKTYKKK
jgi:hypothetical protein